MSKNRLSLRVLKSRFAELHPPLSANEAVAAAARCLFCYDAPCTRACPTHIDVPRFIRQIMHGDAVGSARTILDANIFGGSCARVCPTQALCEGACVEQTMLKSPVEIGRLQRYACDTAHDASLDFYQPGPPTGRHVAVVGAGPAGLSCAHLLRRFGHAVDVYEASDLAGGLNTVGIAAYKMPTDFALSEVERVRRLGMKLHLRRPIDGAALRKLLVEYDAVCLAIGLGRTAPLGIPGETLPGVVEALDFIAQTHRKPLDQCAIGRQVVVIGGGNTAIDVANAAVRLGAEEVIVAYRRDEAAMPAFRHEHELAVSSGVRFEWCVQPTRVVAKDGRVAGVRLLRVRLNGTGRAAKLAPIAGSDFTLAADMVIKARWGRRSYSTSFQALPGLKLDRSHKVVADAKTRETAIAKLFVAGDCRSGMGEEVVYAVQDGKCAAEGIHARLTAGMPSAQRSKPAEPPRTKRTVRGPGQ